MYDENTKYLLDKRAVVGGENLVDAKGSFDQTEGHAVSFRFDTEGALKFGKITTNNIGYNLAKNIEETLDSIRVKIVEKNKDRAEYLANELNNTIIINGDVFLIKSNPPSIAFISLPSISNLIIV